MRVGGAGSPQEGRQAEGSVQQQWVSPPFPRRGVALGSEPCSLGSHHHNVVSGHETRPPGRPEGAFLFPLEFQARGDEHAAITVITGNFAEGIPAAL